MKQRKRSQVRQSNPINKTLRRIESHKKEQILGSIRACGRRQIFLYIRLLSGASFTKDNCKTFLPEKITSGSYGDVRLVDSDIVIKVPENRSAQEFINDVTLLIAEIRQHSSDIDFRAVLHSINPEREDVRYTDPVSRQQPLPPLYQSEISGLYLTDEFLWAWEQDGNDYIRFEPNSADFRFAKKTVAPILLIGAKYHQKIWIYSSSGQNKLGGEEGDFSNDDWLDALRRSIRSMPDDYNGFRSALEQANDKFRRAIASALEPKLNEYIARMPQRTYEDKKALAKWIGAELRVLGLAVKSPKAGNPCRLMGNPSGTPGFGRFIFEYTDEVGKRQQPASFTKLPYLEIVPEDLSLGSYSKHSRSRD